LLTKKKKQKESFNNNNNLYYFVKANLKEMTPFKITLNLMTLPYALPGVESLKPTSYLITSYYFL